MRSQPGVDAGPPAIAPVGVPLQSDPQSTVELTIRAQAGDQAALEALCLRCLKSLTRYAAGRLPPAVRGMVETQDVVLEAVQRGMCRLHEFEVRHPGALLAYMRTILSNLIVDYVRSAIRRHQQVSLDEHHADRGQSPLERVLDGEQIELYEAALERLKPRDAALVTLRSRSSSDTRISPWSSASVGQCRARGDTACRAAPCARDVAVEIDHQQR